MFLSEWKTSEKAETRHYNIIPSGLGPASPGSNFRLSATHFSGDNHSMCVYECVYECVHLLGTFFFQLNTILKT